MSKSKTLSTRKSGETRGRPRTGRTNFTTMNIRSDVRDLVRRYLVKHEHLTGENIPLSTYCTEAILEKLNRDRAEL